MLSARYVPASILADVPGSIELICIWQGIVWPEPWAVGRIPQRPYNACVSFVLIHGRLLEYRLSQKRQCPNVRSWCCDFF